MRWRFFCQPGVGDLDPQDAAVEGDDLGAPRQLRPDRRGPGRPQEREGVLGARAEDAGRRSRGRGGVSMARPAPTLYSPSGPRVPRPSRHELPALQDPGRPPPEPRRHRHVPGVRDAAHDPLGGPARAGKRAEGRSAGRVAAAPPAEPPAVAATRGARDARDRPAGGAGVEGGAAADPRVARGAAPGPRPRPPPRRRRPTTSTPPRSRRSGPGGAARSSSWTTTPRRARPRGPSWRRPTCRCGPATTAWRCSPPSPSRSPT